MTGSLRQTLGLLHRYVAQVLHFVTQRSHAFIDVGHAHGGGPHVHAAPARAQVERRSDDGNVRLMHEITMGAAGTACAETQWSREYVPARRSTLNSARYPCQTRRAEPFRTCAGPDTSRTPAWAVCALRCGAPAN